MAQVGTAVVKFATDTAQYTKGTETAKKANKSFFDDLKSNFGKSSALGQSLKILAGSGAIFALGKIASEFDNLTKKIGEYSAKVAQGEATWGDFSGEMARSIPVVGSLGDGLANIYELVSGDSTYAAGLAVATKRQNEHTQSMVAFAKAAAESREQWAALIGDIDRDVQRLHLSGLHLKLFDIGAKEEDEAKKIGKALGGDSAVKALQDAHDKKAEEVGKLGEQIAHANDQIKSLNEKSPWLIGPAAKKLLDPAALQAQFEISKRELNDITKKLRDSQSSALDESNAAIAENAKRGIHERMKAGLEAVGDFLSPYGKQLEEAQKKAAEDQKKRDEDTTREKERQQREQLEKDKEVHRQLVESHKKWAEENEKLTEKAMSPLERYQHALGDLRLRYAQGGISAATFDRLRGQALGDLRSESQKPIDVITRRQSAGTQGFEQPKEDEQTATLKQIVEMFRPVVQKLTSDPVGALMSLIGGGNS